MKIVGLIVEYNPLHTGHVYHFTKVKEFSKADLIVAIMSSSFTMRGEISVFNKFIKTRQALQMGIDIVIELPYVYSVNNANLFAAYAVTFLNNLQVSEIWIGSENNDPTIYENYYSIQKTDFYNERIKYYLKTGLSYKMASVKAFNDCDLPELASNDTLGLFYYESIKDNQFNISLKTIKREGNNYLDDNLSTTYSSAKSIRSQKNNFEQFLPNYVLNDFKQYGFLEQKELFPYLNYRINTMSFGELQKIFLVNEGIEYKIKKINADNYHDFFDELKTKRYTDSRLRRILLYILFNITEEEIIKVRDENINFLRVLGFKKEAQNYLNKIKKQITIFTNIKDGVNSALDIELRISKTLDLIYKLNIFEQEQKGPIIL